MSRVLSASAARRERRTESLLADAHVADRLDGDRLRCEAVVVNMPLALDVARRFERRGVEHDDLVQVAMLGLVEAVRRYRPGDGPGFSGFAVPTITGELKRYFRDHGWAVRPPRAVQELRARLRRAAGRLEQELGHEPSDAELAEDLGASVREVRRARLADVQYQSVSLDARARGEAMSLGELLPDRPAFDPYDRVVSSLSLRSALSSLDPRLRLVLRLRFADELTQRQIGQRVGLSQMQVSRLLTEAIARLRGLLTDADRTVDAA